MKFKLGLLMGGAAGFMIGSGRAQQMLRNARRQSAANKVDEAFGQSQIDYSDPAFAASSGITSITLTDESLLSDPLGQ